jgi:quercetin 2,3-dioxygenase
MTVSRTLPQRALPTIGAWCFLDSYGPGPATMAVLPHPHTGLQTVTWLLSGTIRHRDSLGSDVLVRPGQLNLMTAGEGVAHSEFAVVPDDGVPDDGGQAGGGGVPDGGGVPNGGRVPNDRGEADAGTVRGLQLWVALPENARHQAARFEQHADLPRLEGANFTATVIAGSLDGVASPAQVHSPLVGAEVSVPATGPVALPLEPGFEHAILVIDGSVELDGIILERGPLAYLGSGRSRLDLEAQEGTRFMLLGGEPFREELLMWWNFVGRSHEEIVRARQDWEEHSTRFGTVPGHGKDAGREAGRIPAPPMPGIRLTPRRRG